MKEDLLILFRLVLVQLCEKREKNGVEKKNKRKNVLYLIRVSASKIDRPVLWMRIYKNMTVYLHLKD